MEVHLTNTLGNPRELKRLLNEEKMRVLETVGEEPTLTKFLEPYFINSYRQ